MATVQNALGHVAQAGVAHRLQAVLSRVTKYGARRRAYLRTYQELNALSQRELSDLGINRSMIRRLALEAAKAA